MRYNIPCQINIIEILRNTFKDTDIQTEDFNFESIPNIPICINGQPIGVIKQDYVSSLWLDITPEFTKSNDKWNLSALNINLKDSEESFKLEYESVWK